MYNFPRTVVINEDARNVSKKHVIDAARKGLVLHDRGKDSERARLTIDILVGGPPCQGFSLIGHRVASEQRNKLVYEFARLVEEIRPRYFVMENVPGMALGAQGKILEKLLTRFKNAGYRVVSGDAQLLNSANFGVPQERKRLFVVGARSDMKMPTAPQPSVRKTTVGDAIRDLPNSEDFKSLIASDAVKLSKKKRAQQLLSASNYAKRLMGVLRDPSDFSHRRRCDKFELTSSMRTEHSAETRRRFRSTGADQMEPVSRFHRLTLRGLANTLRAGTGRDHGAHTSARPIHPTRARVITVREAARIHSFPDWFRFHATKWHGFRQVGNSVPPLMARAVAASIMEAMRISPIRPKFGISRGAEALLRVSETSARNAMFGEEECAVTRKRKRAAAGRTRSVALPRRKARRRPIAHSSRALDREPRKRVRSRRPGNTSRN